MDFIGRGVGVGHLHGHRRMTCGFLDLDAVRIPADGIRTAVLAVDGRTEVDGRSQNRSLTGDLQRQRREDGGDVHVLGEVGVLTGLARHTIAPLDKDMVFFGNSGDGQRLGRIGHGIFQAGLTGILADAQSTTAAFIDLIADFVLLLVFFLALTACAGRRRFTAACGFGRAAGSLHRRARV